MRPSLNWLAIFVATSCLSACGDDDIGPAGPDNPGMPATHTLGDAVNGKQVFRSETFGNEGFWTDALKLPQGIVAAGVTPVAALKLGLSVDVEALDATTRATIAADLAADPTGASSTLLNSAATTVALVNANAIIGFAAKDSNGDGVINVAAGDKVGATCALCHAITDGSVLNVANGGSVGVRIDGPAVHFLDVGGLLSVAQNSRAYFPVLQLTLAANGGNTLGRAPTGLTKDSTEAEVDAYLSNKSFYPVGMFDDTVDGNGDPMHNMPLFRQDLAAPFGSEGALSTEDNFANLVYTALLDPTVLTTPGGRAFVRKLGGTAAGDEIVDGYISVLAATGVTGYPYVQANAPSNPAEAGTEAFPLGVRVDNQKLIDMNAYLFALPAPAGVNTDNAQVGRGRKIFRDSGCTGCHNVDQNNFVPTFIVPMKTIFPGDAPLTLLAQRTPPLNPILDTPGIIFDDKMAVVNASIRGLERGIALPLLLDLARKPVFLHDNSVATLEELLAADRPATSPHPFPIQNDLSRAAVVAYLKSLSAGT